MLASVTKKYIDHSTPEAFTFSFYCDRCGKQWNSEAYVFSSEGFEPPLDERVRTLLWNQQREAAYERANREATVTFNRCTLCGSRVCDDCFYMNESDYTDVCRDCAQKDGK